MYRKTGMCFFNNVRSTKMSKNIFNISPHSSLHLSMQSQVDLQKSLKLRTHQLFHVRTISNRHIAIGIDDEIRNLLNEMDALQKNY